MPITATIDARELPWASHAIRRATLGGMMGS